MSWVAKNKNSAKTLLVHNWSDPLLLLPTMHISSSGESDRLWPRAFVPWRTDSWHFKGDWVPVFEEDQIKNITQAHQQIQDNVPCISFRYMNIFSHDQTGMYTLGKLQETFKAHTSNTPLMTGVGADLTLEGYLRTTKARISTSDRLIAALLVAFSMRPLGHLVSHFHQKYDDRNSCFQAGVGQ